MTPLDDVPGGGGLGEVLEGAGELHAHVLQPVDGVGGLGEVGLDQIAVHPVVGVLHVDVIGLFQRQVLELPLLDLGADAQRAHAHIGGAAGGVGLLKHNGLQVVFTGSDGGGQAGGAGGDNNDVGLHGFHSGSSL